MIKAALRSAWRNSKPFLLNVTDEATYARRFQRLRKLGGLPIRISYQNGRQMFLVEEEGREVYVARRTRLEFQVEGIRKRQQDLYDQYTGGHVALRDGDIVLDCGANIGEFSMHCSKTAPGVRVYSFEPDPVEYCALEANATPNMTLFNMALWNGSGTVDFYDKNDSGDSSILNPGGAAKKISVTASRLDELANAHPEWDRIRLFKLEAEGAEPEILDGAGDLLDRIDYIAVDMGPERGLKKENTVCEVLNKLYARGFELIFFKDGRNAGLFRNVGSMT